MNKTFPALLKDNFIKRLWVLALSALFFFFYFVVGVFLNLDLYLRNPSAMSAYDLKTNTYLFRSAYFFLHEAGGAILLFLGAFALLLAFTSFSFLSSQSKVDCYHSLPVTRKALYGAGIIISFIELALPYLIFSLISAAIAGGTIGYDIAFSFAFSTWISNLGFFALMFSVAVVAMMLSSHGIVGVALACVFFFIGPVAVLTVRSLTESYFTTLYYRSELFKPLFYIVSPALWGVAERYTLPLNVRVIGAWILSALFFLIGLWLYRKRRSEANGRALSFTRIETPLKIAVTVVAALSFTSLIVQITGRHADGWAAFGLVSGTVICHLVFEVVYALDFRSILKRKWGIALSLVIGAAVLVFFRFDLMGYDSYVPDESEIASAGFYSYLLDGSYIDDESVELIEEDSGVLRLDMDYAGDRTIVDRMEIRDPSLVLEIARSGAANAKAGIDSDSYWQADGEMAYCLVHWQLNNGKSIYRKYYINYRGSLTETILSLSGDIDYKRGVYPILTKDETYAEELTGVDYQDALGIHEVQMCPEALKELFETYVAELSALTPDTRLKEMPVYSIRFVTKDIEEIEDTILSSDEYDYLTYQLNYISRYPVYPSFSGTLGMLGRYGVSPLGPFTPDDISYITISYSLGAADDSDNTTPELLVTDHDEIEEILHAPLYSLMAVSNELYPICYELNVTVGLEGRVLNGLYMGYDSIPKFVREYFGVTDEDFAVPDMWYNEKFIS